MFKIEDIDPVFYRKQTRKSTMIIMAIFVVIGFIMARLTVGWLGDQSNNHIVLNFIGAFIGLLFTFAIVNVFFKDADWMKEAMYAWRLKRHLMAVYNIMNNLKRAVEDGDKEAIKIMRFYQLGTAQMYHIDNNSTDLIELKAEMRELETQMNELGIDLNQNQFDMKLAENYRSH